jgi:hypothetical protein
MKATFLSVLTEPLVSFLGGAGRGGGEEMIRGAGSGGGGGDEGREGGGGMGEGGGMVSVGGSMSGSRPMSGRGLKERGRGVGGHAGRGGR